MPTVIRVQVSGEWYTVELPDILATPLWVVVDGEPVEVDLDGIEELIAEMPSPPAIVEAPESVSATTPSAPSLAVRAPLPGVIVSVEVSVGDRVEVGD